MGGSTPSDPRAFLGQHSAFRELSHVALDSLAARMTSDSFAEGDRIIRQGEDGDSVLVVVEGTAEVRLQYRDGLTHTLATVSSGEVLGEMALVTGAPRNADVIAMSPVRTLTLAAPDFFQLMVQHSEIAVLLTNIVSDRLGRAAMDGLGDKILEGYRVMRPRGRGAMAVVYEGEDAASGERVALKMMSHRLAFNEAAMKRFEREADMLVSLSHPSLACCHGRFPAYGTCFMVMEYCDGPDIGELIRQVGALPLDDVRRIAGSVAVALRHVHERGVVHGDVKPANLMINLDGTVKLTDFGIATAMAELDAETGTEERPIVGSPWYMAPEQFRKAPPDPRTDVYALGCVLYEMITSEPLFEARNLGSLIAKKRDFEMPPADKVREGLDDELYGILAACLAVDPAERTLDLATLEPLAGPVDPKLAARGLP